jgi:hypothetical protein
MSGEIPGRIGGFSGDLALYQPARNRHSDHRWNSWLIRVSYTIRAFTGLCPFVSMERH